MGVRTDLTLDGLEIIEIYGLRFKIEFSFKQAIQINGTLSGIIFGWLIRPLVGFIEREQMDAILDAPNLETWSGRRDRALFTTMYNTGARVSAPRT